MGEVIDCNFENINLIKPIDKGTVHRICSGQVVLNLAVAVKELVENSIDAGATNINIHLKEYGSELIEVSDNASGITEANFEFLTLKHYTSKIQNFEDLAGLTTLGFRGEALSSLCALCNLSIVTKHESAEFATKIVYDHKGHIKEKSIAARERGTTVTLENLFSTLPVRRKEFLKNLKRDFTKMCQLLYAYCLVSKKIKLTCANTTNKGNRSIVVATEGSNTVRENIINVFGAKQISTLIEVETVKPEDPILTEYDIKLVPGEELPFILEFFISSVTHGSGRSSGDRQFYFINGRPCEPNKLMKLINEVYKQFNSHQYPFVYLNIITKTLTVDVNVTPDKRQVFFENEKLLLATVKASLLEIFKTFPSTYRLQNLDLSQNLSQSQGKGMKRHFTDSQIPREHFFVSSNKKIKSEESPKTLDLSIFMNSKEKKKSNSILETVDDDIEKEVDSQLDTLIKMACKLSKDKEEKETLKSIEKEENLFGTDKIFIDSPLKPNKQIEMIDISLKSIQNALNACNTEGIKETLCVKFRSEIEPECNKDAEEELQKQITKDDFAKMEIIGQFNLGFILAKLDNDLFIIDQHATDEKYNFEQLQQNTVIESQILVNPKPLDLTAGNEQMLIEHLDVFKRNGFLFEIDESASCTKKVALTAVPISKNFVFGKDDIDEMLFMLKECGNVTCRPSRVRSMFALRACRKSVMIGKSLSRQEMRKLIDHMGEIDQPWNCPHGRPTMRHLINLNLIKSTD